ncbi:MAG: nucleoside monophosphate kinase [Candidatus Paceibacterota bacterium]|jgi:adenylate kinase
MQPQTFVFFGQVGSGKGTQVKLLIDFLKTKDGKESVYAGTGEGFRKLVESSNYAGQLIKEKLDKGELVDNFFANSIITNILGSELSPEKHLILDGYPRNVAQSKVFEDMMEFFKRDSIKIIYIKVEKEEAIKRMLLRGRHDDTKEGIAKRFDEYENNVIPAMDYFKDRNDYKIYTIEGEQSVENVHKDIIKALNL